MLMSGCELKSTRYNYQDTIFLDETYTTTGLVALILTVVSLFYGLYMIVAGCKPVR